MFRHTKIFLNNNTETEYKSFGTCLCLRFHIVTFYIKVLVVHWHQFMYTSSYHVAADSILQIFIMCEAFTSKVLLHFWKQEKVRRFQVRTVWRMLEDVSMEFLTQQGLCLPGRMRTCIVGLQKTKNTSHLTVGGILNRQSHGHSYLCTYHVTRSDVQLHEAIFNITLNTRNV